ncbi:mitochondrial Rho GTPase 2-like protein [Tanacetum coccineum]
MSSDTISGIPICDSMSSIRVVVVGDHGTGKSSLIAIAATESFPKSVSPMLSLTCLSTDYYLEGIPVIIIDTSLGKAKLEEELKRVDVIVLIYDCDKSETLDRL